VERGDLKLRGGEDEGRWAMSVMGVVLGNIWKTNEISKRWREHGALRCVGMHAPAPAHLK